MSRFRSGEQGMRRAPVLRVILLMLLPLTWISQGAWADRPPVVLVLGDSLSAAYGIDQQQGWVRRLEQRMAGKYPHTVINASVSGETSGGGLARLPALLQTYRPEVLILELGGNDGLRGHPIPLMRRQLADMIAQSREAGAQVLLLGMRIPPNYGARYTADFQNAFTQLAEEYAVPLVPFFLEGVAGHPDRMQSDGIHPTAAAQPQMLDNVWPALQPLLSHSETPHPDRAAAGHRTDVSQP